MNERLDFCFGWVRVATELPSFILGFYISTKSLMESVVLSKHSGNTFSSIKTNWLVKELSPKLKKELEDIISVIMICADDN